MVDGAVRRGRWRRSRGGGGGTVMMAERGGRGVEIEALTAMGG